MRMHARNSIRLSLWAVFAAIVGLLEPEVSWAQEKVTLRLDWVNSGYHAIWYYGIDKGIFKREGVDLEVLEGRGSATTAQTVANGSVMFGTADSGASISLISQGLPLKIVAGYLRQSPVAIIFPKKNNWKSFADMKGSRIGFSPGGTSPLFNAMLKSTGLEGNVQVINVEGNAKPAALLDGRVDCIESFDFLQVPLFEANGLAVSTLPYAQAGINVPGLSLVTANSMIDKNPALVRKMVGLMLKTIEAARQDPDGAIDSLMKRAPALKRDIVTPVLKLSFNLLDADWSKGRPPGWMSPAVIEKSQEILLQYGGIKEKRPIEVYFTNQFVAGS
jgi:NitT/TauT family transport system substrate-binding protein